MQTLTLFVVVPREHPGSTHAVTAVRSFQWETGAGGEIPLGDHVGIQRPHQPQFFPLNLSSHLSFLHTPFCLVLITLVFQGFRLKSTLYELSL